MGFVGNWDVGGIEGDVQLVMENCRGESGGLKRKRAAEPNTTIQDS